MCEALQFEAYRADDVFRPGPILQDIISGLVESDVIIAEITPTNANVFYELGYAHARNTPTVLLARRNGTLPLTSAANASFSTTIRSGANPRSKRRSGDIWPVSWANRRASSRRCQRG